MPPRQSSTHDAEHFRQIAAARRRVGVLAHWLDNVLVVPGTRWRFGLDSLLGLIPGVGDLAGLLLGGMILAESLRVGAPNRLVARMVSNSLIDSVLGAVPLAGDAFDFAFRSNAINARLLLSHLDAQSAAGVGLADKPVKRGPLVVLILLVPVLVFALAVYAMVSLFQKLYS